MANEVISQLTSGTTIGVGGGVAALLIIANKIWYSIKGDARDDKKASKLDEATQALLKSLRDEMDRLSTRQKLMQDEIDELRQQRLSLITENATIKLRNAELIRENQWLRDRLGLTDEQAQRSANNG